MPFQINPNSSRAVADAGDVGTHFRVVQHFFDVA
jgi:hypothetical protein